VDLFSTNPTNCPNRPNHLSPVYKLIGGHFCLYSIYSDDPTNWAQSSPNYFSVSHSVVIFVWAQYVEMAHNNHHARLRRQPGQRPRGSVFILAHATYCFFNLSLGTY
jgi:hypothetical protein